MSINYKPTTTPAELVAATNEAKKAGRKNVLLNIQRGNRPAITVPVKIQQG